MLVQSLTMRIQLVYGRLARQDVRAAPSNACKIVWGRNISFHLANATSWKLQARIRPWPISKRFSSSAAASTRDLIGPTRRELLVVALRAGIPMIGFGFMDNLVMIQAGEAIDASFGVVFGLSTLTAAGFGQCFSDVAGITCGGLVDATVTKLNLPRHHLSPAQLDMRVTRVFVTLGGCIGVVTGCLLGMSCLLFMDTDRAERAKKAKELQSIFETIMEEGHLMVGAERATLFMMDDESKELWSRVATGTDGILKVSATTGIVGACASTGQIINIPDAYLDARFNQDVDKVTGYRTRSVLAAPVRSNGEILGVIQMINKKEPDGSCAGFDANDEKLVAMLASHAASFIQIVNGS